MWLTSQVTHPVPCLIVEGGRRKQGRAFPGCHWEDRTDESPRLFRSLKCERTEELCQELRLLCRGTRAGAAGEIEVRFCTSHPPKIVVF